MPRWTVVYMPPFSVDEFVTEVVESLQGLEDDGVSPVAALLVEADEEAVDRLRSDKRVLDVVPEPEFDLPEFVLSWMKSFPWAA